MARLTRRISKSTKQYIIVCIIAVVVTGSVNAVISLKIFDGIKTEHENQIKTYEDEMNSNKRTVYIATKDVMAGDILAEDSVLSETVYATQPQDTYLDKSDIGKIVLVDIKEKTQVLKSMITENIVDDSLREVEYNTILISTNILENDFVDVRIAYPNGEDYSVLSKKNVKGYTGNTVNCFFWLNEEEIINMRNAVVDAYLYTGSYLYTTKYIEPNLQEATIVNYTPSIEAIKLIEENPNIIERATNELSTLVRKALENRLSKSLKKNVAEEKWNILDDYIYQQYEGKEISEDEQVPSTENEQIDTPSSEPDTDIKESIDKDTDITVEPEVGDSSIDEDVLMPDLGDSRKDENEKYDVSDYFNITEG